MTKAADVLGQMTGEAAQCLGYCQPLFNAWCLRVETQLGKTFRQLLALIPPGQRSGQRVDLGDAKAKRSPASRKAPLVR
jgi:hypothetical protein